MCLSRFIIVIKIMLGKSLFRFVCYKLIEQTNQFRKILFSNFSFFFVIKIIFEWNS